MTTDILRNSQRAQEYGKVSDRQQIPHRNFVAENGQGKPRVKDARLIFLLGR
jgi:hypothetical protein